MKNKIRTSALIGVLTLGISTTALASPINIDINNHRVTYDKQHNGVSMGKPFVENGVTQVPVRLISEELGYNVDWDQRAQSVTVEGKGKTIVLRIGKNVATVNGKIVGIDIRNKAIQPTSPEIRNGRTYVPLRFIAETLDNTVEYIHGGPGNKGTAKITMSTGQKPVEESVKESVKEPVKGSGKWAKVPYQKPTTVNGKSGQFEQRVFELVNMERQKAGVGATTYNHEIAGYARFKSNEVRRGFPKHKHPVYGFMQDTLEGAGFGRITLRENLANGHTSPEEVVSAWMSSRGHRAAILGKRYTQTSVGHIDSTGRDYWTLVMSTPR